MGWPWNYRKVFLVRIKLFLDGQLPSITWEICQMEANLKGISNNPWVWVFKLHLQKPCYKINIQRGGPCGTSIRSRVSNLLRHRFRQISSRKNLHLVECKLMPRWWKIQRKLLEAWINETDKKSEFQDLVSLLIKIKRKRNCAIFMSWSRIAWLNIRLWS